MAFYLIERERMRGCGGFSRLGFRKKGGSQPWGGKEREEKEKEKGEGKKEGKNKGAKKTDYVQILGFDLGEI